MHVGTVKPRLQPYPTSLICITRVCSLWSRVSRSCPTLWTLVEVPFPRPVDLIFINLSLELSAELPLTLRLNGMLTPVGIQNPPVVFCRSFMSLVASTASRWKEVSITLSANLDVLEPLRILPAGCFTSLERASTYFPISKLRDAILRQVSDGPREVSVPAFEATFFHSSSCKNRSTCFHG